MIGTSPALALGLVLVAAPADAAAEIRLGAAGGLIRLDLSAPRPLTGVRPVASLDLGATLAETTVCRVRVLGFEGDGLNVIAALGIDWQRWRLGGLTAAAGLSLGRDSGAGHYTSVGGFVRWPLGAALAVRVELSAAYIARNDLSGPVVGITTGAEYAWRP